VSSLVYLAAPYSHIDPHVRETRFLQINEAASHFMRWGFHVFSPISHGHPIALAGGLPTDWEFWRAYSEEMIGACGVLLVLQLPGWDSSTGVAAEVGIAEHMRLPVVYVPPGLEGLRGVEPCLRRILENKET